VYPARSLFYELEDLRGYQEIADLYRPMKTSFDRTKDYQQAGWFYFNEFEMKRLAFKSGSRDVKWYGYLQHKIHSFLYYLYKILAGYGEKPSWSFIWFIVFTLVFTTAHLLSGLQDPSGMSINYDISITSHGIKNLFSSDFIKGLKEDVQIALVFTLYRVIPTGYLPYQELNFLPSGICGWFWSLLNSIVLILMLAFVAIGLKRHFRRF